MSFCWDNSPNHWEKHLPAALRPSKVGSANVRRPNGAHPGQRVILGVDLKKPSSQFFFEGFSWWILVGFHELWSFLKAQVFWSWSFGKRGKVWISMACQSARARKTMNLAQGSIDFPTWELGNLFSNVHIFFRVTDADCRVDWNPKVGPDVPVALPKRGDGFQKDWRKEREQKNDPWTSRMF